MGYERSCWQWALYSYGDNSNSTYSSYYSYLWDSSSKFSSIDYCSDDYSSSWGFSYDYENLCWQWVQYFEGSSWASSKDSYYTASYDSWVWKYDSIHSCWVENYKAPSNSTGQV